ncbi:hypothetical protein [Streptomyces sp. NPDC020917]
MAIEAAIRVNEALAEWARWAEEADLMTDASFGRPGDAAPPDPPGA